MSPLRAFSFAAILQSSLSHEIQEAPAAARYGGFFCCTPCLYVVDSTLPREGSKGMNIYYGFLAGAMFLSGVAVLTHYATAATEPDLYKTAALTIISFGGAMLFLMMGAEL